MTGFDKRERPFRVDEGPTPPRSHVSTLRNQHRTAIGQQETLDSVPRIVDNASSNSFTGRAT
ncbi:hypothetical protein B0G81_3172 [Paraburkholderia sp. BL6665CI2N2]|nr:hypothetical protein B0G81_3172 [Paraburkholderia sp. BL6665CI2N2]